MTETSDMPIRNSDALHPQATGASVTKCSVRVWEPPKGQATAQPLNTDSVSHEMVRHLYDKRTKKRG